MITSEMIGKVVTFQVYPDYILGMSFNRCKVLGLLDAETARLLTDIASLSTAALPSLPVGTPSDYRNYVYVKVKLANGNDVVVAQPWIKGDTLKIHEDVSCTLKVDRISADDVQRIVNILKSYNYNYVTVVS